MSFTNNMKSYLNVIKLDMENSKGTNQWNFSLNSLCSTLYSLCLELYTLDEGVKHTKLENSSDDSTLLLNTKDSLIDFSDTKAEHLLERRVDTFIRLLIYLYGSMPDVHVNMPQKIKSEYVDRSFRSYYQFKMNQFSALDYQFMDTFIDNNVPLEDRYELKSTIYNNSNYVAIPKKPCVPYLFLPINIYSHMTADAVCNTNLRDHDYEETVDDGQRFDFSDFSKDKDSAVKSNPTCYANMPVLTNLSKEEQSYYDGLITCMSDGFLKLLYLLYGFDLDTTGTNSSWLLVIMKANVDFYDVHKSTKTDKRIFPIIPPGRDNTSYQLSTELTHQLHLSNREIFYGQKLQKYFILAFKKSINELKGVMAMRQSMEDMEMLVEQQQEKDVPDRTKDRQEVGRIYRSFDPEPESQPIRSQPIQPQPMIRSTSINNTNEGIIKIQRYAEMQQTKDKLSESTAPRDVQPVIMRDAEPNTTNPEIGIRSSVYDENAQKEKPKLEYKIIDMETERSEPFFSAERDKDELYVHHDFF